MLSWDEAGRRERITMNRVILAGTMPSRTPPTRGGATFVVAVLAVAGSSGAAMGPISPAGTSTGPVEILASALPAGTEAGPRRGSQFGNGNHSPTSEDVGHPLSGTEAAGEQGPQYSMPFATICSGATEFDNGGFGILGQVFVGTISNAQYTMQIGALPALVGGGPPTPLVPPALPVDEEHQAKKHRYISIDATTNLPNEVSIKVEIAEMNRCQNDLRRSCIDDEDCPTVCQGALDTFSCSGDSCGVDGPCIESGPCGPHPDVGLSWYVQQPQTRGEDCPNGYCDQEDWYSRVAPLAARAPPYSSDWHGDCNGYGGVGQPDWTGGCTTLHIGDCEIVPGVIYNVYACDALTGDPCSDPLAVETTRKPQLMPHYGDVAGAVTVQNPCCFTPPDDYTSVIDFGAYLLTNQNWGTTADPQAHPTWIDLHGPGAGIPPQYIIMVTDLTMLLRAFVDIWPYENTIGGLAPGDCP